MPSITKEQLLQAQLVVATAKKENKATQKPQSKKKPRIKDLEDKNQPPSDSRNKTRTVYVE
jgi:cell division protein FtsB